MSTKNYYQILGLNEKASGAEIKKIYRQLAKKYHPDLNRHDKSAEARFKDISEAYYVLGDEKRRREYDQMRQGGFNFQGGRGAGFDPAAGFNFEDLLSHLGFSGRRSTSSRRVRMDFGGFDDIFGNVFTGSNQRVNRGSEKVDTDLDTTIKIPASLAQNGGKIAVKVLGKKINVKIPPGIEAGTKMRLKGFGNDCPCCGKAGDLLLKINF